MHAWSEVEHDLIYKPVAGNLSEDEYAILDQLNGLVHAGEIALERLQKAGQRRVGYGGGVFANHYDLANFLLGRASNLSDSPVNDSGLGRVDILFGFMTRIDIKTAEQLAPQLEVLHNDFEKRPLAEQIIDALLKENQSRYAEYVKVRQQYDSSVLTSTDDRHRETGAFLTHWNELERLLQDPNDIRRPLIARLRAALDSRLVDGNMVVEIDSLRRMRNELVHGREVPPLAVLREASGRLRAILKEIARRLA